MSSHAGKSKTSKKLIKLCHKAARKSLGLKKADLKHEPHQQRVTELGTTLLQCAVQQKLPFTEKREKKETRKHLSRLALQRLAQHQPSANDNLRCKSDAKAITRLRPASGTMAFALSPLKRKPCGGCAALRGGLCQCALKLAKRQAS